MNTTAHHRRAGGARQDAQLIATQRIAGVNADEGGQFEPSDLLPGRWDLMPDNRYMWASVQTVRGCPKHCSFCSVWKTDGQRPRQRASDLVIEEIVTLDETLEPVAGQGPACDSCRITDH